MGGSGTGFEAATDPGVERGMTMLAVSEPLPKSCGIDAHCPTVLTFAAVEMDALATLAESMFSWVRSVFLNAIFWLGTLERSTPSNLEASMLSWLNLAIAESSRLLRCWP
jgi:hypothetical protein